MLENNGQEVTKKKNKRKALTLEEFYIQNTEQTAGEVKQLNTNSPQKNENLPQALQEHKCEIMRKMEEIWQENWEIVRKENNSLKGRMFPLELG